jgi:hypothetical protein
MPAMLTYPRTLLRRPAGCLLIAPLVRQTAA